ncbi:MAG: hypothetical protein HQK53_07145 [Oligoflexia bacterium]|nr:hypothetical protein [Oligoflexia bacterium]
MITLKINFINFLFYALAAMAFTYLYWHQSQEIVVQNSSGGATTVGGEAGENHVFYRAYYYLRDVEKPSLFLNARVLTLEKGFSGKGAGGVGGASGGVGGAGKAIFEYPRGVAYDSKLQKMSYTANSGYALIDSNDIFLEGNVTLSDDLSEINARTASYVAAKDYFVAEQQVKSKTLIQKTKDKLFVDADKAISWPSQKLVHYIGRVVGRIDRARPYEPGINFTCEQLNADANTLYVELLNNVYIKRENLEARSLRGEIFLENYNKKLKYYVLYDDVRVVDKIYPNNTGNTSNSPGGSGGPPQVFIERRAYSEKLEGIVKEEKIVLTGYPKLIQEKDIIKGNKITFYEKSEVVEVDDSSSSFILKKGK